MHRDELRVLWVCGRDGAAGGNGARLRRFRYRACGQQFNERSTGVLNRTCLPSDVIALVVFCRLRCRLTLRDLSEIMALREIEVSYEAVRD